MKIAVLYNTAKEGGFLAEDAKYAFDAIANAKRIVRHFNKGGHKARLLKVSKKGLNKELGSIKGWVDIIFNLTESVGLDLVLEVIGKLEELKIPFAGAGKYGHKLTSDKMLVKQVFKENGIPTPEWKIYTNGNIGEIWSYTYPVIVKATTEHGSMSIHQDAVSTDQKSLNKKVKFLLNKYHGAPVLVEEYIEGPEINSTVIGSYDWIKILPLSEVVFLKSYQKSGRWPIYTYEAKYNHHTPDFDDAPARLVDWLSRSEIEEIEALSAKICRITECFDYARIDIRYDMKKRVPYFIDLNSYPCLLDDPVSDTICVSRIAIGWDYVRLIEEIAKSGKLRHIRSNKINKHALR